jgi:hypothetical protein
MNWIQENKFLAGFFAALIAGVAGFGFLLYSSIGNYSEVSDNYARQATELKRLQTLVPYPNEENLKKMRDQKDAYVAGIHSLEQNLSTLEFPLAPMRPEEFQDELKKTVNETLDRANETGTKLPAKFYLGFDIYQSTLPKGEAAAPLGRELKAISNAVGLILNGRVDAILDIKRVSLPEEVDAKAAAQRKQLVSKYPFEITFVADQGRFRRVLNDIVSSQKQFYIVRSLTVKNEKQTGPSRQGGGPDPAAPNGEGAGKLRFIVGTEKLTVTAKIEVVDFTPPATK